MSERWQTTAQLLRDRPHVKLAPLVGGPHAGTKTAPVSPPRPDAALQQFFQTIEAAASAHGWIGQHTYNAEGPDAGLHMTLVREQVLFAEVALTREALTTSQQAWLAALRRTGQVEVYSWIPADLPHIYERLRRSRKAEHE